jgi:hypothetical protein
MQVSFIRHRDLHLLTLGTKTFTPDNRFQNLYNSHNDEWSLKVIKRKRTFVFLVEYVNYHLVNNFYAHIERISGVVWFNFALSLYFRTLKILSNFTIF